MSGRARIGCQLRVIPKAKLLVTTLHCYPGQVQVWGERAKAMDTSWEMGPGGCVSGELSKDAPDAWLSGMSCTGYFASKLLQSASQVSFVTL